MNNSDFSTTLLVDQTQKEVFDSINNVRGWWSEEIVGDTHQLNAEFNYHFEDIHRCQMKIVEFVPNEKVVWLVLDNHFKPGLFGETIQGAAGDKSTDDRSEWTGTKIIFEIAPKNNKTQIRFTHQGLVPAFECFDICVNGWTHYIRQSLFNLITTGEGEPNSTGRPKTNDEERFHDASESIQ